MTEVAELLRRADRIGELVEGIARDRHRGTVVSRRAIAQANGTTTNLLGLAPREGIAWRLLHLALFDESAGGARPVSIGIGDPEVNEAPNMARPLLFFQTNNTSGIGYPATGPAGSGLLPPIYIPYPLGLIAQVKTVGVIPAGTTLIFHAIVRELAVAE